jgi:hypothetical protein
MSYRCVHNCPSRFGTSGVSLPSYYMHVYQALRSRDRSCVLVHLKSPTTKTETSTLLHLVFDQIPGPGSVPQYFFGLRTRSTNLTQKSSLHDRLRFLRSPLQQHQTTNNPAFSQKPVNPHNYFRIDPNLHRRTPFSHDHHPPNQAPRSPSACKPQPQMRRPKPANRPNPAFTLIPPPAIQCIIPRQSWRKQTRSRPHHHPAHAKHKN